MRTLALAMTGLVALLGACSEERAIGGECEGADCAAGIHPAGIDDPQSADFHGAELARRNYDFALCASCHGADFTGGALARAPGCTGCHAEGPTACVTCHGADGPTTGAHATHTVQAQLACAECHRVPAAWDAPGHIVDDPTPDTAEVVLGEGASRTPPFADRAGAPSYAQGTCGNVYCHGDTLAAGGQGTDPAWTSPLAGSPCTSCHGTPPPSHAPSALACASCHPTGAGHIDGNLDVGGDCNGCHGTTDDGAPPRDLEGNTSVAAIGVGAHQAHVLVPSGITAPIACATCHLVPATLAAAGHIDSAGPAEVAPALGWDRTTRTCAQSCHGPARPVWTEQPGMTCGSCHGYPPTIAPHVPSWGLSTCGGCHPFPSSTAHMDGDVDVL